MNKIKEYWEKRAIEFEKEIVTHRDNVQVEMEIETISRYLNKDDKVLDVGCGNGYSANKYSKYCDMIVGIDFASFMIDSAIEKYSNNRVGFYIDDITDPLIISKFSKNVLIPSAKILFGLTV